MSTAQPAPAKAASLSLEARVSQARQRARHVLRVESAWIAVQWPLALIGGYALSGLVRVPQSLPDTLHAFLLAGVGGGALALAARNLSRMKPPRLQAIDRRLEQKSNLRHRPLAALDDFPADGDETLFWQAHMERLRQAIGPLRAGWPALSWTPRRMAGWAGFGVCLALALVMAGSKAPSRLEAAFLPGVDDGDVALPQIEAWIDLPAYAPGAPVFLSAAASPPRIPQDATLTIHVTGARSGPHLLGVETGDVTVRQLDPGSWSFTTHLMHSGRVSIRSRGRTVGEWQFEIEPDLPPEISWQAAPHKAEDGTTLLLPYHASQAHGIARLWAEITLPSRKDLPARTVPIPLKAMPTKPEGVFATDLTESLWAGEKVTIRLHAASRGGKENTSKAETVTLPARVFHNPTARALISLRHRLGLGQDSPPEAADELRALAGTLPQDEKGSMLALLYAAAQLDDPDADQAQGNTLGLCWAVALYLEDLATSDRETAQANLEIRAAQRAVQDQIAHMRALGDAGHTEEEQQELSNRLKRLKDALDQRMQALMQRSLQMGTAMPDIGETPDGGTDPASRLMRRLQSDAANGQADEALKRLEELSKMAERMRSATPQDLAQIAQQLQARARAQAQRAALHDLVRRETTLLDHVQSRLGIGQRAAREAEQNQSGSNAAGEDVSTMPTAELLRRLGMTPPPDMDVPSPPPDAAAPAPLTPEELTAQHEQRRSDHAAQRALQMVARLLNDDIKALTGKTMDGLTKADRDMKAARQALASAKDGPAETAIRQVLKDLAETGQQMTEAQKGKNHGGGPIALLPTMGTGQHAQGGGKKGGQSQESSEDDDTQGDGGDKNDRDPLGRKMGKGHSGADTDGTVPDADSREKAREIERELRRRDADRTRPQSELDYLDRLLKSY
ncbi:DUF4175 domain-containing protein [Asaia sp. W19]|uniref:DUF4175 domain-containing protein n=1 Tax=unclassified Asaia TaxID=2685023 RepID=UPI000F8EA8A8|nr:DUF4175 family protein [Asaia sp. W19]RUT26607.1 DUF4175 domain-containing protein [Asaia sp. W19]